MNDILKKQMQELGEAIRKSLGLDEELNKTLTEMNSFIPAPMANFYIKLITDKFWGRQLFRAITMPGATFTIPSLLSAANTYYQPTKGGTAVKTSVTSGQVVLTARKLMSQIEVPMETFEDFNPNNESSLDEIIADAFSIGMATGEEKAVLMGDRDHAATATTEGAATEANWYQYDPRLAFNGLLTIGLTGGGIVIDAEGAAATTDLIRDIFYRLGKYAQNRSDVFCIWNSYSALQLIDEPAVKTLDKYGPNASIVTGETGNYFGSKQIESTVLSAGYAVASTIPNCMIGDRRLIKVKSEEQITTDSMDIVGSERVDFQAERAEAVVVIKNLAQPSVAS